MAVTITTQPDELMLARNPIAYVLESDLTGQDIRFSIIVEVESVFGLGDFSSIGEFQKVADANKQQVFDISDMLYTTLSPIEPDATAITAAQGITHSKRYRIQYKDFDESTDTPYTTSTEKYALLGAWQVSAFPNRGANLLPTGNKVMTTRPQVARSFMIGQYEWLWLLPITDGTSIDLVITVTFDDGNVQVLPTVNYGLTTKYKSIGIPLHDSIHNYSSLDPSKEIVQIQFEALGETLSVKPDFECFTYIKEFLYLNSLGGFDSLITYGQTQRTEETTKNTAEIARPYNYTTRTRQYEVFNEQTLATVTVSSGYRSRADRDGAKDIIRSQQVYIRSGEDYLPIFINPDSSISYEQDGDFRYKLDFEFSYANEELGLTPA